MRHEDFHALSGKPIRQYIFARNSDFEVPEPVGVMVGVNIDGVWNADYAIAHEDVDEFDSELGTKIAYGRAIANRQSKQRSRFTFLDRLSWTRNQDIAKAYYEFCLRCQKYYKECVPSDRVKAFAKALNKNGIMKHLLDGKTLFEDE